MGNLDTTALAAILAQLPLVLGLFIAFYRGIIRDGPSVKREMDFREELRKAALAEKERERLERDQERLESEKRIEEMSRALRDITDVMERSVSLYEKLASDNPSRRAERSPRGSPQDR